MAASYFTTGSETSVQVLGPTSAITVERVLFTTVPTRIALEYPVPINLWRQNKGADFLTAISQGVEQQISEGLAVTGSFAQDTDLNGLLIDYCDFVVQYVPPGGLRGPYTTIVRIALDSFVAAVDPFFAGLPGSPAGLLSAALADLEATANL